MELITNIFQIRGTFCIEEIPKPSIFVVFGASGDLTSRKLLPAIFSLYKKGLLPSKFFFIGVARTEYSGKRFKEKVAFIVKSLNKDVNNYVVERFLEFFDYISGDYNSADIYKRLKEKLTKISNTDGINYNIIFYMATPPAIYIRVIDNLGKYNLVNDNEDNLTRVVVEKPFGKDLKSAKELNDRLRLILSEEKIYRIDHYLGKETVQNILLFRFANNIFEPIWNRNYIDNIQITVAEDIGIGHRAGYFDKTGLLRDMFQNHILQILSLVTMEPPISFNADRVRDEKVKLLRAIKPIQLDEIKYNVVRGQYIRGTLGNEILPGYLEESGVEKDSKTETFVAARVFIENWRWHGVPVYIRARKRLRKKATKIVVVFKRVPHSMFYPLLPVDLEPNILIFHVQPDEGISLRILAKHPGPKLCMDSLEMDFRYKNVVNIELPDAYERLLIDCMLGDQTLFIRSDDMEVSWSLITPVIHAWEKDREGIKYGKLYHYPAGSWGPKASEELLLKDGRRWVRI